MQAGPLRRVTRRPQPRPTANSAPPPTTPVAIDPPIRLSTQYLALLQEDLNRAQTEQAIWAGEVATAADAAREERRQTRWFAVEQARISAEQQQQEQRRDHEQKLAQHRARLEEWEQAQRQERERIRLEQEQAAQRQREERAAAEEAFRREAEEAERRRRETLRECAVCMDENDMQHMVEAPCQHWYCRTCLRDGIEAALASRSIFNCCQRSVPIALVADLLPANFQARYELMELEQNTPNPTYCANAECAAFIPPANYHGPDYARCLNCQTDTCRHCRTRGHEGRACTSDQATEQLRALAAVVGWKACPRCGTMVERRDGCLHMTCLPPCRAEFCYRCGGDWERCRSRCGPGGLYH